MKRSLTILGLFFIVFLNPLKSIQAEERQSVSALPFSGYFLTTSDHAIDGLLFEDNQLYIYLTGKDSLDEGTTGQEWVGFLEEFHSFPHPDLKSYTGSVRDVYLEEYDLAYDLKDIYEEIAGLITPEMGQTDIQQLINNRVPGIYYTEKNDYQYYIIASPTVSQDGDRWHITLFGEELYTFEVDEGNTIITDQDGVEYEYISGIKP